jgi:hypothetical protein
MNARERPPEILVERGVVWAHDDEPLGALGALELADFS